jgi:hypothetical protein
MIKHAYVLGHDDVVHGGASQYVHQHLAGARLDQFALVVHVVEREVADGLAALDRSHIQNKHRRRKHIADSRIE